MSSKWNGRVIKAFNENISKKPNGVDWSFVADFEGDKFRVVWLFNALMWSKFNWNSISHVFWWKSFKLRACEVSKVHWLFQQKSQILLLSSKIHLVTIFFPRQHVTTSNFQRKTRKKFFPSHFQSPSRIHRKEKTKNIESIPSRLSIAFSFCLQLRMYTSHRDMKKEKKGREGKITPSNAEVLRCCVFRFSQSPHFIHPASHTTSEQLRSWVSFSLPSFTRKNIYSITQKNPSRRPVLAESFSVDPSNGEHLHSFRVPEWLEILYCVEFSHSFSRRSRSDEWQTCAIRRGGNTSVTDLSGNGC